MRKHIVIIIGCIASIIYFFFTSYLSPYILISAFNYSKGIANNPEGIFLMPYVWIIILIIVGISIIALIKFIKTNTWSIKEKIFVVLPNIIAVFVGNIMSYQGWKEFIICFTWYIINTGSPFNV